MSFLTGTPTELSEQAEAIGTTLGYPVAPRIFRDGIEVTGTQHDASATVLAANAGRIRYEPEIVVSDDGTEAALAIEPRAEEHLGKTARAGGKDVAIKARGQLREKAALPQKVREVFERRDAQPVEPEAPAEEPKGEEGGDKIKGGGKARPR